MTHLAKRKTKLSFATEETIHYKRKERKIMVEVFPHHVEVHLSGIQQRYAISWNGIFTKAAAVFAIREKDRIAKERQLKREARRG